MLNILVSKSVVYIVRNGTPPTDQKRMNTSYGMPNNNAFASSMTNAKRDGGWYGYMKADEMIINKNVPLLSQRL